MERLKTGIPGFDELMGGGVPKGQLVLVTGTSGTGKTLFCSQAMYNGLVKGKENAVFLSFEEPPNLIKENVKEFGWNLDPYQKSGKLIFLKYDPYHIEDVFDILDSTIRKINAKRVFIDSISALGLHVQDNSELRRIIFNLSDGLRKLDCTAFMTSEIVPGSRGISRYGVEEFVADSVVVFYYERSGSTFSRAVQIWKVRGSSHSDKLHPYAITDKGLKVSAHEEAVIKR